MNMTDISGKNIVNKINFQMLAKEFSEFFFVCWKDSKIEISNVIEDYTRLKYKNIIYKGKLEIITLLFSMAFEGIEFEIIDFDSMESGSRRIDIMITGNLINKNIKHRLSIYFLLTYQNESWKLQNSILNILI
jgi:hypothetical protein